MKRFLTTILVLLPLLTAFSQTAATKEVFVEAEMYFLYEEYNEALPLYLKIHRAEPENDNINYKIGVCFLNDPYQKDKSIRYLEDASKNINTRYKENNFKEKAAPPEAFFYLGNAYLVNNNIDKALENFNYFREILDENIYDVELVEEQINICNTAKNLMKIPVDFDLKTLSANVNSQFTDMNPIVSGDGKRLVYVSKRRFYDATMFSEKVDGVWQPPRMILPELGVDRDVYPSYLNYDGTMMIIYRSDDFIGNLYQSELIDGHWTNMHKIGGNINTKYWESHGSLNKDGSALYFTSNRKGGYGGLDIYKSEKQADGSWGEPVNLGETINTRYNEETPFVSESEEFLYFCSYGHYNMGGYDVFYSKKNDDGQWDIPINMGYPINTTDDDLFFFPVNNGNNAYFSMYSEDGQGLHDLYYLDVYTNNNPRMYMISGFLFPDDESITEEDDIRVFLLNRITGDTIDNTIPDIELRKFTLRAPQGKYNLLVKSNTYKDALTPIDITRDSNKEGIELSNEVALETKPYVPQVFTGVDSKIEAEDSVLNVKSGDPVKIKLKLEKDAMLIANVYVDSVLTATDTFMIDKKRFTYEMVPEPGLNTIELILVEENGDQSKRTILVYADAEEGVAQDMKIEDQQITDPVIEDEDVLPLLSTQDSINRSLEQITNRLSEYADGNLKSTLDELNVSELELNSMSELLDYLRENADENGYTEEDIDRALANSVSGGDVDILHELMTKHSEGALKEFLENLDPEAEGLTTPELYMQYLRENAKTQSFTNEDIDHALINAGEQVNSEAELMRLEMMKYADEPMKELLGSLDVKALNIQSKEELMDYLYSNAEAKGIDSNELEIQRAISENERDAEQFKSLLLQNTHGPLYDYLLDLDLEAEGISTNEELITHLIKVADNEDFTLDEVYSAIKYINNEQSPVREAKDQFLNAAGGELKAYLDQLDLGRSGLYTPELLIQHLLEMAGTTFPQKDLLDMFSKVLEDVDVEVFLAFMIKNGSASQRSFLKNIDLEAEGINTISDLITFLLKHSDELGMNKEGLMLTLNELMGEFYLENLAPGFEVEKDRSSSLLTIGGGLITLGLISIIIFIIWKKRRNEEEENA